MYRSSAWVLGIVWEIDRAWDARARLAVAEERLRVARDLHHVLGHNLALIAVGSELAAQLTRRGQHDEATGRILQVGEVAQDSRREVREIVVGYRTADLDTELAGARSVQRSSWTSSLTRMAPAWPGCGSRTTASAPPTPAPIPLTGTVTGRARAWPACVSDWLASGQPHRAGVARRPVRRAGHAANDPRPTGTEPASERMP